MKDECIDGVALKEFGGSTKWKVRLTLGAAAAASGPIGAAAGGIAGATAVGTFGITALVEALPAVGAMTDALGAVLICQSAAMVTVGGAAAVVSHNKLTDKL